MKITAFQLFRMSMAVAAGWELGKALPEAVAYALNKTNRQHYKRVYRQKVAEETAKQNGGIRVVPDQAAETPTS